MGMKNFPLMLGGILCIDFSYFFVSSSEIGTALYSFLILLKMFPLKSNIRISYSLAFPVKIWRFDIAQKTIEGIILTLVPLIGVSIFDLSRVFISFSSDEHSTADMDCDASGFG